MLEYYSVMFLRSGNTEYYGEILKELLKNTSIKLEKEQLDWLADQVRLGRFATISHGIRFAIQQLMKEGEKA